MANKCPRCGADFSHTACAGRNSVYKCGRVVGMISTSMSPRCRARRLDQDKDDGEMSETRKCLHVGCEKTAEFEIYDSNERRPDVGPIDACEDHVGVLLGSCPPVEPLGPWTVSKKGTV